MKIGQHIKELRKQKGISQQSLADTIGVTVLTIKNIENGKTDFQWSTGANILRKLLPRYSNGKIDYRSLHRYFE